MPRVTDKGDTRAETGDKSHRASYVKLLIEFDQLTCDTLMDGAEKPRSEFLRWLYCVQSLNLRNG